jgi:hypothetical protein
LVRLETVVVGIIVILTAGSWERSRQSVLEGQ